MTPIYLDNSATTRPDRAVFEAMAPWLGERCANPSSLHSFGQAARAAVETARRQACALIGADPGTVFFTSGGTESDNLALQGAAAAAGSEPRRIVASAMEHSAVARTLELLEGRGFEVVLVPPGTGGAVDVGRFAEALAPGALLACVMHVNNETGAVQPVRELAAAARERGALFFTDAVQSVGKIPVDVGDLGVDLLAFSSHKIHGPMGVGALYIRPGTPLRSLFGGGPQERERRPGTENVPGVVGFGEACRIAREGMAEHAADIAAMRDAFEDDVRRGEPGAWFGAQGSPRAPHVSSVALPGVDGDGMVIALDMAGVAASSGSACSSGHQEPSPTLTAMGLPPDVVHGAVRFSFSRLNTMEEARRAAATVLRVAGRLRASLG